MGHCLRGEMGQWPWPCAEPSNGSVLHFIFTTCHQRVIVLALQTRKSQCIDGARDHASPHWHIRGIAVGGSLPCEYEIVGRTPGSTHWKPGAGPQQ